jgi:hypothetical protein
MGIAKFIDAMTKGYELAVLAEPKIAVGDRVVYIGDGEGFPDIGTVTRLGDVSTSVHANDSRYAIYVKNLRLATEEELSEELMWNELGRKVGEFRVGDHYLIEGVLTKIGGSHSLSTAKRRYLDGDIDTIYPVGTYVRLAKGGKA